MTWPSYVISVGGKKMGGKSSSKSPGRSHSSLSRSSSIGVLNQVKFLFGYNLNIWCKNTFLPFEIIGDKRELRKWVRVFENRLARMGREATGPWDQRSLQWTRWRLEPSRGRRPCHRLSQQVNLIRALSFLDKYDTIYTSSCSFFPFFVS